MDFFNWLLMVLWAALRLSVDTTQFLIFLAFVLLEMAAPFAPRSAKPVVLAMSAQLTTGRVALIALFAVIGMRLLLAPYWVWEDEHLARNIAECRVSHYINASTERQKFLSHKLRSLLQKDEDLMDKQVSADALNEWTLNVEEYWSQAVDWIKTNMGDGAVAKLRQFRDAGAFDNKDAKDQRHLLALDHLKNGLAALIDDPSKWDEFAPEVKDNCHEALH